MRMGPVLEVTSSALGHIMAGGEAREGGVEEERSRTEHLWGEGEVWMGVSQAALTEVSRSSWIIATGTRTRTRTGPGPGQDLDQDQDQDHDRDQDQNQERTGTRTRRGPGPGQDLDQDQD